MAFTRDALLQVSTLTQAINDLQTQLTGSGFQQVTDLKAGTFLQDLLQLLGTFYVYVEQRIAQVTLAACEPSASGSFLDALSDSHFDNQRTPGLPTVGQFQLALATGNGPYSRAPGEVQVTDGTYVYSNLSAFTLNAASAVQSLPFVAAAPGTGYNIGITSSLSFVTNLNGVAVTNPPVFAGDTWISQLGVDTESDNALHIRNETKWATLETAESSVDRIVYNIVSASAGAVTQVYVDTSNPNGPGTLVAYCASDVDVVTPSAGVIAAVQDLYMNGASRVQVVPTVGVPFASGTLANYPVQVFYTPSTDLGLLTSGSNSAFAAWLAQTPVGGNTFASTSGEENIADINDLVALLYAVPGVKRVRIGNQGDITLQPNQKLTPPPGYSAPVYLPGAYLQLTASLQ